MKQSITATPHEFLTLNDSFTTTHTAVEQAIPTQPTGAFHFFSYLIGLLSALLLVGGSEFMLRRPDPAPIVLHAPPTAAPTVTPLPTATPAPMIVFVSGAVARPGIYGLPAAARVADAIAAAGGLSAEANGAIVNQAEPLWDGVQVHVPSLDTTVTLAPEPPSGVSGSEATGPTTTGQSSAAPSGVGGLINVNNAAATELETLPGIGPSKAAAIIANRPFSTVDDLERVPGIGARTIEQLRPLVTVQ